VDGLVGQGGEEAFDEVEPGAAGRGEVEVHAGLRASQALTVACLRVAGCRRPHAAQPGDRPRRPA
jgi:hypothetical protein